MKKWIATLFIVALLCPLIGCGSTNDSTIWVVTELTTWDRMNGQAQVVQEAFEEAHPGVKIRLDILPTEEKERSAYLQQLRNQIMQGRGPDAYLLPTDNQLVTGDGKNPKYITVEPLFADVMLAMESGMFQDVSQWYDADDELQKDSLNTTIMDAGVLEGNRYVLPLRYDIPVIYAQTQVLEETGFDLLALNKPISELMQAALDTGNGYVVAGGLYDGSEAFADWIDYDSGRIALKEDQLTSYVETYQQLLASAQGGRKAVHINVRNYVFGTYDSFPGVTALANMDADLLEQSFKFTPIYPLYIGTLAQLLEYAPVAQYEESEYAVLPLQAEGGGTVATVTYYAAMGSGCKNPELTYAFLRQFLLEESQWEQNRPNKMNILVGDPGSPPSKHTQDKSKKNQYPGLIESGWPVRTEGSLGPLWDVRRKQFYSAIEQGQYRARMRKIGLCTLEEQWAQILETPIDQVRFPSVMDEALSTMLSTLSDSEQAYQPVDASAQSMAKALLWDMLRHVSEG